MTQIISITPSGDVAASLQAAINANAGGEVVVPNGVWNIGSGLVVPAGGVKIRGETAGGAILHLLMNGITAISGASLNAPIALTDLTISGTAPVFNGSNIQNAGQNGVHFSDCTDVQVNGVRCFNLSGTAFDLEAPSSSYARPAALQFSGLTVFNSFRAFYAHNSFEYAIFSRLCARNNTFGFVKASGNLIVDAFQFVNNAVNIQVLGGANANPGHGTFCNGMSNHGYSYNLDVLSCPVGEDFVNVRMLGDAGGSLTAGGGEIRIANSRGVALTGCTLGSNIVIQQSDPVTGSVSSAGANHIDDCLVRDEIAGFVPPTVGYAGGMKANGNVNLAGVVGWNS